MRRLVWDELRQCGVMPERRGHDGYRRPDPRYCHDYGPEPVRKPNPAVVAAMTKMEGILAKRAAEQATDPMAKAVGLEEVAPDETELDAVDLW